MNNQENNTKSSMRKVALSALAGTSIEWYDFFLYGAAAALIFPSAFFGYRHACYQGLLGAFMTGGEGVAFCVVHLWFGRTNVLPLIFAHGIFTTLRQPFRHLKIKNVD